MDTDTVSWSIVSPQRACQSGGRPAPLRQNRFSPSLGRTRKKKNTVGADSPQNPHPPTAPPPAAPPAPSQPALHIPHKHRVGADEGPATPAPSTAPSGALSSPPSPPSLQAVADRLAAAGGVRARVKTSLLHARAGAGAMAVAAWHSTLDTQRVLGDTFFPLLAALKPVDLAVTRAFRRAGRAVAAVPRGAAADAVAAVSRVALIVAVVWLVLGVSPFILAACVAGAAAWNAAARRRGE